MNSRLVIIGAGGHGKVIADIASKNEYTNICFVDDNLKGSCLGFPIVGTTDILYYLNDGKTDFIIAVGDNKIRKEIAETFELPWVSLIHPSAQIATQVRIGMGTVVMAGTVINPASIIGKHCIINSSSVIEHDNVLGDYVHISPNAALGGAVHIGDGTHIGLGVSVRNNIEICENCIVGVGSVVVEDLIEQNIYVGVPAKILGSKE